MGIITNNKERIINKNDKISIIGYVLSLLSFLVALIFFMSELKTGENIFLITGGILLFITSIYKIVLTALKKTS